MEVTPETVVAPECADVDTRAGPGMLSRAMNRLSIFVWCSYRMCHLRGIPKNAITQKVLRVLAHVANRPSERLCRCPE